MDLTLREKKLFEKSQFWGSGGRLKVKKVLKLPDFPLYFAMELQRKSGILSTFLTLRRPPELKNEDFSKIPKVFKS